MKKLFYKIIAKFFDEVSEVRNVFIAKFYEKVPEARNVNNRRWNSRRERNRRKASCIITPPRQGRDSRASDRSTAGVRLRTFQPVRNRNACHGFSHRLKTCAPAFCPAPPGRRKRGPLSADSAPSGNSTGGYSRCVPPALIRLPK